jgi:NAD(P)-dependent dehydrogenase (short-subunit alcohol dehydrogenase family)
MNLDMPSSVDLISLKGRRALITGSASGIGRAMARRFAETGADLELVDIDLNGLEAVQEELKPLDVDVSVHRVDLSVKAEVDSLWGELSGREPSILVNNAGIYPFRDFLEVNEDFLRRVMDINMNSVFWMCQNMIRARMREGGVIVNVGTIEAILPFKDEMAHYSASKAGVIAITRALARDYGRRGFRINALIPGGILTPGTKNVAKKVLRLNMGLIKTGIDYIQRVPMGRLGKPDEVARIALVLASDLSSYVNGALIPVDGGFLST